MSQFTQLNLSGNSGSKPAQAPAVAPSAKFPATEKSGKKHSGTATVMAIGGSLAAAAVITALMLGTNGCSKSSQQTITTPMAAPPTMAKTAPIAPAPAPSPAVPASASRPATKHSRQHILFAYKDADYGVSFLYPKEYKLRKGAKANLKWAGIGPVDMNFVQPGGQTLAAVRLPDSMFPGTDFVSGFFNVSVNPKVTSEQCAEFAFEDQKQATADAGVVGDEPGSAAPSELKKVKFGATEFTEAESSGGGATNHVNAKYYHVYGNGACYEFSLGLETTQGSATDSVKPLDTNTAFRKLNWMLSTVKITGMQDKVANTVAGTPETSIPKTATPKAEPNTAQTGTANVALEGAKN